MFVIIVIMYHVSDGGGMGGGHWNAVYNTRITLLWYSRICLLYHLCSMIEVLFQVLTSLSIVWTDSLHSHDMINKFHIIVHIIDMGTKLFWYEVKLKCFYNWKLHTNIDNSGDHMDSVQSQISKWKFQNQFMPVYKVPWTDKDL